GSDFQFAGYYFHAPSTLNLTLNRAYSSTFGRRLSRDPIEEDGGLNLYAYVEDDPVDFTDPTGLDISGFRGPLPSPVFNPSGSTTTPVLPKPRHGDPERNKKRKKSSNRGVGPHKKPPPPKDCGNDKHRRKKCRAPEPGTIEALEYPIYDRLSCW